MRAMIDHSGTYARPMTSVSFDDTYHTVELTDVRSDTVVVPVTGQYGETMGHELTSANLTLKASAVVVVQQARSRRRPGATGLGVLGLDLRGREYLEAVSWPSNALHPTRRLGRRRSRLPPCPRGGVPVLRFRTSRRTLPHLRERSRRAAGLLLRVFACQPVKVGGGCVLYPICTHE